MMILKKSVALAFSILVLCTAAGCTDGESDRKTMNDATAGYGTLNHAADDVKDDVDKMTDDVKDDVDKMTDEVKDSVDKAEDFTENAADDRAGSDMERK